MHSRTEIGKRVQIFSEIKNHVTFKNKELKQKFRGHKQIQAGPAGPGKEVSAYTVLLCPCPG